MNNAVANTLRNASVLILGGGGLVGTAIAKHLGRLPKSMRPSRVVVAALTKDNATEAVRALEKASSRQSGHVDNNKSINGVDKNCITHYVPAWGDIFVNESLANVPANVRKEDPSMRATMMKDTLGDFGSAYDQNQLVKLVREHKPNVIVDCINTATVISYQNIFDASTRMRQAISANKTVIEDLTPTEQSTATPNNKSINMADEAEKMIISLSAPQIIRHVRCLQEVAKEQNVQGYLKIGTTGTGGMGLNIPYTHGEDKPSQVLMAKTEAAFGHSGLLMLWAMTPGAPFVKEIKPAAAIGYKSMEIRQVKDLHGNSDVHAGRLVPLSQPRGGKPCMLSLREDPALYPSLGPMRMAIVDMGENGVFTKDEFLTITEPNQMELISPEEISELAVQEILSVSTGHNVLAAMRGALLGPGYRAGINRMIACEHLEKLGHCCQDDATMVKEENRPTLASVALGKLGPPAISKLLFEARILANRFKTWQDLIENCDAEECSQLYAEAGAQMAELSQMAATGTDENLFHAAISVGVPILLKDNQLLRGPNISIPPPKGIQTDIPIPDDERLNDIADQGWIDLRPRNLERWKERARTIVEQHNFEEEAYVAGDWHLYKSTKHDEIDPPTVAAWILAVELGGHRDI